MSENLSTWFMNGYWIELSASENIDRFLINYNKFNRILEVFIKN